LYGKNKTHGEPGGGRRGGQTVCTGRGVRGRVEGNEARPKKRIKEKKKERKKGGWFGNKS